MTEPITADVLSDAPELATLAALEMMLLLAAQALAAEHSTLRQQQCHIELLNEPVTLREARCILRRITRLRAVLVRYRRAVLDALLPCAVDDAADLPF